MSHRVNTNYHHLVTPCSHTTNHHHRGPPRCHPNGCRIATTTLPTGVGWHNQPTTTTHLARSRTLGQRPAQFVYEGGRWEGRKRRREEGGRGGMKGRWRGRGRRQAGPR